MTVGSGTQWEDFLLAWDEVFAGTPWETVTEGSVAGIFAAKLLELLDWAPTQRQFHVHLELRVGSKWHDVFPDIVLSPPGKEAAKTPGKPYAVIELKRPGLADEDARMQARCYADHLRAPVYSVIDGERIRVWHRRLVDGDVEELNLPRAEFSSRYDELRDRLGRSQLEALHDNLKGSPDEIGVAREHAAKKNHNDPTVRLRLDQGKIRASINREAFLDAKRWWGHPVGSASAIHLSIAGPFDDWRLSASDFVDAIARVAVHEGKVRLAVDEPASWRDVLQVPLNLERHHAAEVDTRATERVDPSGADEDLGAPKVLATELHAALDQWVLDAVNHRLVRILDSADSPRHKHWLRKDVRNSLGTAWQVDVAWLRSTLCASATDDVHASTRLGPRTVPYLVDAVLFPMAVARVLTELRPCATPDFPHNLDHTAGGETPAKVGFAYALDSAAKLDCDTFLLLLSSSSLSPALVRPERRIGAPSDPIRTRWRISEKAERGIVCCLSEDARTRLETMGWDDFASRLTKDIRAQHALQESECPADPSTPSLPPSSNAGPETTAA